MTVVWTTLATLLFLMPGFAFLTGVFITDKNVSEIVFRTTLTELAYVGAISLTVHTLFFASPFDPGLLIDQFANWYVPGKTAEGSIKLSSLVSRTLFYSMASAFVGGLAGFGLGKAVAGRLWLIFLKHRWMVEVLGSPGGSAVYARVLTISKYATGKDPGDFAILIEGYMRDVFFASDGTVIYLTFISYQTNLVKLEEPAFGAAWKPVSISPGPSAKAGGALVLERPNILMVQYEPLASVGVSSTSDLQKLSDAISDDE